MAQELVALAIMGIDQHENGVMAISRVLAEAQMRVDYLGKYHSPASVAEKAIAQDADVVGISCHSWEYLTLVPALIKELRERGSDIEVIIGGSVITPEDRRRMEAAGVAAVFTSAMDGLKVVETVRSLCAERRRRRAQTNERGEKA
jgi:methylmalonyl-CoA mutase C-terminal domain/subunit